MSFTHYNSTVTAKDVPTVPRAVPTSERDGCGAQEEDQTSFTAPGDQGEQEGSR